MSNASRVENAEAFLGGRSEGELADNEANTILWHDRMHGPVEDYPLAAAVGLGAGVPFEAEGKVAFAVAEGGRYRTGDDQPRAARGSHAPLPAPFPRLLRQPLLASRRASALGVGLLP